MFGGHKDVRHCSAAERPRQQHLAEGQRARKHYS